jgi:hypothetical protein
MATTRLLTEDRRELVGIYVAFALRSKCSQHLRRWCGRRPKASESRRVCSLKPRTVMSSIMRARNGLTGRSDVSKVIGLSPELKVAGPSMLGIGRPDRHVLPRVSPSIIRRPRGVLLSRASGFVHPPVADPRQSPAAANG